jgi:sugar (pentulose or hexulose) kinase
LAPLSAANAVLGTLTQKWAEHTGLSSQVQILCGLHDSNAALLAARNHAPIEGREATVLSTGTWFVAMRSPSRMDPEFSPLLAETRDCLVNVDVEGAAVPSSRFMGGREIEILVGADRQLNSAPAAAPLIESAMRTIQAGDMILPSGVPGVGPYPNAIQRHVHPVGVPSDPMTGALLYAALLADVALDLIGSRDCLIIDGRFSQEPVFTRALASLRPSMTVLVNSGDDGVARGALNLLNRKNPDRNKLEKISPIPIDMNEYRARWRDAAEHAA